jgi:hypothetical protein
MEINQRQQAKKIHHHAVPIVIVTLALLVVSIALVFQQNTTTGNESALVQGLLTRPLNIRHSPNGFARITLNKTANKHISPEVEQAGRTTELILNLNGS